MTFHPLLVVDDDGTTHVGKEAAKASSRPSRGREEGREGQDLQVPAQDGLRQARGPPAAMTLLEIQDVIARRRRRSREAAARRRPSPRRRRSERPRPRRPEGAPEAAEAADAEAGGRRRGPARARLLPWRLMAHKKGGGSSRNGRDSNSKRLGVKASAARRSPPAPSSCASAAPGSTPATASARAATTRCSRCATARSRSTSRAAAGSPRSFPPSSRAQRTAARPLARRPRSTHAWIRSRLARAPLLEVARRSRAGLPLGRSGLKAQRAERSGRAVGMLRSRTLGVAAAAAARSRRRSGGIAGHRSRSTMRTGEPRSRRTRRIVGERITASTRSCGPRRTRRPSVAQRRGCP